MVLPAIVQPLIENREKEGEGQNGALPLCLVVASMAKIKQEKETYRRGVTMTGMWSAMLDSDDKKELNGLGTPVQRRVEES